MEKKRLRSTSFRSGRSVSKREQERLVQERLVGELFREGYEQATGIRLEGNDPGGEPPDRLFSYQNLRIGVEMFELGQFHESGAFFEGLTNSVYSEFESRGASKSYEGTRIDLGILKDVKTEGELRTRWRHKGIRRKQELTFAEQFVDLLLENVSSRDAVPKEGRVIGVDPALYPAVSVLTKKVIIHRCPMNTVLRTDGKAAPLVTMSPGYLISNTEIEESIRDKMAAKMKRRAKWKSPVAHSVLIAHDIPRGQVYEGFVFTEAHKWLLRGASRVDLLQTFDELWLVTLFEIVGSGEIRRKAQRICGRELGQHPG
jgi:hypothetical protein